MKPASPEQSADRERDYRKHVTKFRDLALGDSFDFISPNIGMNSFYGKCHKVSDRQYRHENRNTYTVGSINCMVYHVNE